MRKGYPVSDYIASNIRTVTGVAVGQVLAWLAVRYGIVIDAQSTAAAILAAGAVTSAAWYALVRQLEKRWPIFGWLLGLAKAPSYPGAIDTTGRPASGGVVAGGPFAGWPVGLPVSVGPMPPMHVDDWVGQELRRLAAPASHDEDSRGRAARQIRHLIDGREDV